MMSTNLYWYPEHVKYPLSKGLKFIISKKVWEHGGSIKEGPTKIGPDWKDFLSGIIAATGDESVRNSAQELLEALTMYGAVYIELI